MSVKTQFSIKDLEHLSGVKAHTIRMWEKRFNLLEPDRTDTNIRFYDIDNLKRLLNVSFLYKDGYKISKIAGLTESEIFKIIEKQSETNAESYAINTFKTAMFDFDERIFTTTYIDLLEKRTFREIFFKVFMPLLDEIGRLWQTSTIEPSHESFISELIKRKITVNIERQTELPEIERKTIFVLFLPYNEIHEIGLLYANYEILLAGYRTIYLGANIPLSSLNGIVTNDRQITFVTYITMKPEGKDIQEYIRDYQKEVCGNKACKLWLMGHRVAPLNPRDLPSEVKVLNDLPQLIETLKDLKKA